MTAGFHGQRDAQDLVLTGPMASGKTTVGRLLAGHLDREFVDLDDLIELRTGRTVPELFAAGEPVFRAAEVAAVQAWLARPAGSPPEVLALGGGTLQHEGLVEDLRARGFLAHLDAPAGVLAHRLRADDVRVRPLVERSENLLETLADLRRDRAPGYARADLSIKTDGRAPEVVAVDVLRALYHPDRGPWREPARRLVPLRGDPEDPATLVEVASLDAGSGVTLGRGAVPFAPAGGAVLLWDSNLPDAHAAHVIPVLEGLAGGHLLRLDRAGGEAVKSAENLVALWHALIEAGADRDTPLWVCGGGTITDLGGLLAHTFKRGVPLALLPTTLLGQLDAALGGKNGINLAGTKNVVGTVRLPDAVHLDPLFLVTLPDIELRGGLAEAVKSGLIGDPGLVDLVERRAADLARRPLPALEDIAARSAAVKLGIVSRDLEEHGERRLLNLGHTLAHALESATRRREHPLTHGDAVSIGLVFAARLSRRVAVLEDRGLPERLEALLAAAGLPVRPPALDRAEEDTLRTALARDKKRFRGETIWVLPVAAGRMALRAVAPEDVRSALEDFRR